MKSNVRPDDMVWRRARVIGAPVGSRRTLRGHGVHRSARTCEIGIRIALGATLAQILALVLRQGARLAMPGIATGAVVAIPVAFLLRSVFFGISPVDPRALVTTAGLLVAAALAASTVPAYRAATVDPLMALRED